MKTTMIAALLTFVASVAALPALAQDAVESVQPTTSAPNQQPPPPPASLPPVPQPVAQPGDSIDSQDATADSQPVAQPETPATGQWVDTQQYGWVWIPYGSQYTSEGASGDTSPYEFVYEPSNGWGWVASPWVWGWGAYPYFGALGPGHFGWYRGLYSAGWGWGRYRGGGYGYGGYRGGYGGGFHGGGYRGGGYRGAAGYGGQGFHGQSFHGAGGGYHGAQGFHSAQGFRGGSSAHYGGGFSGHAGGGFAGHSGGGHAGGGGGHGGGHR